MITNPNHKLFDEFKKKYSKLLNPVIKDLKEAKITEKGIDELIATIFESNKIEPKLTELVLQVSVNAAIAGGVVVTKDNLKETKNWLLKNNWSQEGLNLSQTIHKNINKLKTGIAGVLKENLGASVNWQKSAQGIYKLKDIKAELPKYIDDLVKAGKKSLQDPSLISDYKKKLKKAQKQINKLANLGYKNPRLKKAYQNIITQVEKGSLAGLDKAVDRSIKAKTKYFAERIARTEIASAYGNAVVYNAQKDKKIVAVKSVLSARHKKPDICDLHAGINLGMGKGIYPKNKVPRYPYHPQCMCNLIPITKAQVTKTKVGSKKRVIAKFKKTHPNLLNKKGEIPMYSDAIMKPVKPFDL